MVQSDGWSIVAIKDCEKVAAAPQIMAFTLNKLAWRFSRLASQRRLLLANPAQFRDCIRSGYFNTRCEWRSQCHAPARRMHGEVNMLDGFAPQQNRDFTEFDDFRFHQ